MKAITDNAILSQSPKPSSKINKNNVIDDCRKKYVNDYEISFFAWSVSKVQTRVTANKLEMKTE